MKSEALSSEPENSAGRGRIDGALIRSDDRLISGRGRRRPLGEFRGEIVDLRLGEMLAP